MMSKCKYCTGILFSTKMMLQVSTSISTAHPYLELMLKPGAGVYYPVLRLMLGLAVYHIQF